MGCMWNSFKLHDVSVCLYLLLGAFMWFCSRLCRRFLNSRWIRIFRVRFGLTELRKVFIGAKTAEGFAGVECGVCRNPKPSKWGFVGTKP